MNMRGLYCVVAAVACAAVSLAGDQPKLADDQVQQIVAKFAGKEAEFAQARDNYTYRQTARIQEVDEFGNPRGSWEMVTDVTFTQEGKRVEHVVRAPVPNLQKILLTPEDEQDLRTTQPFVLTTGDLPKYLIRYLGKQNADEIPCYVFAVKPKKMESGLRYFMGEIWVDDRDMQIVKTYGRGVGLLKSKNNLFPKFETYRQQVDGKYWFPTYTRADDTLYFAEGPQRIREIVKYEDYKQFRAESQIKYGTPVENPKPPEPKKP